MRLGFAVVLLGACGNSNSNSRPTDSAPPTPVASNAPVEKLTLQRKSLQANGASIEAGAYSIDLDGDGTSEPIDVAPHPEWKDTLTLTIDGKLVDCQGQQFVSDDMGRFSLIDLDPKVPGVELFFEQALGDADEVTCVFTKFSGKVEKLDLYSATIEGTYIVARGSCQKDAAVYARTTTEFVDNPKLLKKYKPATVCCEGIDCP